MQRKYIRNYINKRFVGNFELTTFFLIIANKEDDSNWYLLTNIL